MTFALLFGLSLANESTQGEEKQDAWVQRAARLRCAEAGRDRIGRLARLFRDLQRLLNNPPPSLFTKNQRQLYAVSAMVTAASEDKTHRGAFIASPTMPWGFGTGLASPSDAYHLVWSRDEYEMVTALIADGDLAGTGRALDFLFNVQQKSDGSFPQNSKVDGTPVWGGLQLDEVGDPIILALGACFGEIEILRRELGPRLLPDRNYLTGYCSSEQLMPAPARHRPPQSLRNQESHDS